MKSILPFDELNRLEEKIRAKFSDGELSQDDYEDILDMMLDLFLLAYATGNEVTNESLSSDWKPTLDDVMDTVDRPIAGATWRERARDYFNNGGSAEDFIRIADTEMHRDANEAALRTAKEAGASMKTWVTMLDDRVRETHDYLEGQSIPIDGKFYTFDGDSAVAPGMFGTAENNVNCRCELTFEY